MSAPLNKTFLSFLNVVLWFTWICVIEGLTVLEKCSSTSAVAVAFTWICVNEGLTALQKCSSTSAVAVAFTWICVNEGLTALQKCSSTSAVAVAFDLARRQEVQFITEASRLNF